MNDASANEPVVDFTLANTKKRRMLYLKRPTGTPIPVGMKWVCVCGTTNVLNANEDQFCGRCGSRLRNQVNDNAQNGYFTTVVVTHFNLGAPPARR